MLILDSANVFQKYPDCLETVCRSLMDHYNFMLSLSSINTEIENFFYQEEFDTFKFYDV